MKTGKMKQKKQLFFMKKSLFDFATFRTLLKGFVFCGKAAIFWTYAIIFRTTHFSEKPWAHGPRAHSGRVVGFKVPRLSAKSSFSEHGE